MNAALITTCPLCLEAGGVEVTQNPLWRVVRVMDANFPAFYRLIWQGHVAEFSQLSASERLDCMEAVARIERVLIAALAPTKINLASFGNMVPHLHWHVIARFDWDSHYPNPIWGEALRAPGANGAVGRLACTLTDLDALVAEALV